MSSMPFTLQMITTAGRYSCVAMFDRAFMVEGDLEAAKPLFLAEAQRLFAVVKVTDTLPSSLVAGDGTGTHVDPVAFMMTGTREAMVDLEYFHCPILAEQQLAEAFWNDVCIDALVKHRGVVFEEAIDIVIGVRA